MKLRHHNLKLVINAIIEGGGKAFLDSLEVSRVTFCQSEIYHCPACNKRIAESDDTFIIANRSEIHLFEDIYNRRCCTRNAISWLYHVYDEFQKRLRSNESDNRTIDDFPIKYVQRILREFTRQGFPNVQRLPGFAREAELEFRRRREKLQMNNDSKQ